jgi:hypothetical protein
MNAQHKIVQGLRTYYSTSTVIQVENLSRSPSRLFSLNEIKSTTKSLHKHIFYLFYFIHRFRQDNNCKIGEAKLIV